PAHFDPSPDSKYNPHRPTRTVEGGDEQVGRASRRATEADRRGAGRGARGQAAERTAPAAAPGAPPPAGRYAGPAPADAQGPTAGRRAGGARRLGLPLPLQPDRATHRPRLRRGRPTQYARASAGTFAALLARSSRRSAARKLD